MKRLLLIILQWPFILLTAQSLQLSPYVGYTTNAILKVMNGRYTVQGGFNYGAAVSLSKPTAKNFAKNVYVELQYNIQQSDLGFREYNTEKKLALGKIAVHTVMLGGIKELPASKLRPFVGALMGFTVFAPADYENLVRVTFSFTGGMKVPITQLIGLRLQAQVIMPLVYNNVYVGWEPNVGLITGVASNGIILSAVFAGGLYINVMN